MPYYFTLAWVKDLGRVIITANVKVRHHNIHSPEAPIFMFKRPRKIVHVS